MRRGPVKARYLIGNEGGHPPKPGVDIHGGLSRRGTRGLSVEQVLGPRRHCYAEKVIDDPRRFDAIEVHDICEVSDPERSAEEFCDSVAPSAFSVYAHLKSGGIDCCGDFSQRSDALAYGTKLAEIHHWPVFDYISSKRQNSAGAQLREALRTMAVTLQAGCAQALDPLDGIREDDRSAISAIRGACEAGVAEIRRQLEANKERFRSDAGTIDGK